MGSDKEDLQRWANLVLDGKPINIDQTIRQQAKRIGELEEAVRVLAAELVELERLYAKGTAMQRPCGYFLAASVMRTQSRQRP